MQGVSLPLFILQSARGAALFVSCSKRSEAQPDNRLGFLPTRAPVSAALEQVRLRHRSRIAGRC